jgi:glutathione S-transferase
LEFSASGKIPFLIHGEAKVWESLAICEYIAELRPEAGLWPKELLARAEARSVATEMHAGFAALRRDFPMDISRSFPGRPCSEEARADIARVLAVWRQCRKRFGAAGPYLFGAFGIADCMFAPVVTRLRTYAVELDEISAAYVDAIFAYPPMQEWCAAAAKEPPLPDPK